LLTRRPKSHDFGYGAAGQFAAIAGKGSFCYFSADFLHSPRALPMSDEPSTALVELLERLRLATPGQVRSVAPYARGLAKDLPLFESVWIDALAQARILTPYQAAEITAGRGHDLQVGPYVLRHPLPSPGYGQCYAAREIESGKSVRLLVVRRSHRPLQSVHDELQSLIAQAQPSKQTSTPATVGLANEQLWIATPELPGKTAADWMIENGRFPPIVVLQIAREMAAHLAELEHFRIVHGDLSATGLILTAQGHGVTPLAGVRGIVRPAEGYAYTELPLEAYDYLAPERVAEGTPPSTASDLFACGCSWWHLLTGRPPFAGGNSLAKLRSVQMTKPIDVRRLAPDVDETLAGIIDACLQKNPLERPASLKAVAEKLGPPTRSGSAALARLLANREPMRLGMVARRKAASSTDHSVSLLTTAGIAAALLIASMGWLVWSKGHSQTNKLPIARSASERPMTFRRDDQIVPATFQQPASTSVASSIAATPRSLPPKPRPLILPTDRLLQLAALDLQSGQSVRGAKGQRPHVQVPPHGLSIQQEGVVFENIDFVWDASTALPERATTGAMIVLAVDRAEFRGCSFQSNGQPGQRPAAIAWIGAERGDVRPTTPIAGELLMQDCVLRNVAVGVESRAHFAPSIEIANTLHSISGPLVRLCRCPKREEPLVLTLNRCTVRDSLAVLECRYQRLEDEPGKITVAATDCALMPDQTSALLLLTGERPPQQLLRVLEWTGQGSLVAPAGQLAAWRGASGRTIPLADQDLDVGGLVRSEVKFAGDATDPTVAASRLTEWQAPLRSAEPPGIGDGHFLLPAVNHTSGRFDNARR